MTAKKETLIAGVFSHKNLGQLVKQQEQQMMKNVDVAEGCNLIKYQLTAYIQKKSSPGVHQHIEDDGYQIHTSYLQFW
jgi:hypothetical protein